MNYARIENGVVVQTAPDYREGFVEVPEDVTAGMVQDGVNFTVSNEDLISQYEQQLENYVDEIARSKGYRNIDSISKYFATNNYFKPEAEALSLWVGNVWVSAQTMLNQYIAGEIAKPTFEDIKASLPAVPEKGIDYTL